MLDSIGNNGVHIDLQNQVSKLNQDGGGLKIEIEASDNDLNSQNQSGGNDNYPYQERREQQADLRAEGKGLVLDINA